MRIVLLEDDNIGTNLALGVIFRQSIQTKIRNQKTSKQETLPLIQE